MTRILITGITGFAGSHLTEALLARGGADVSGVSREGQWPAALAHLVGRVRLCRAELSDESALAALLRDAQPEQIYHLAGWADVGRSFQEPAQVWRDNLEATRLLYDTVVRWGGRPRVLYVGSGLAYGLPRRDDQVIDEDSPFYPVHPYATSKAAADLLSFQYTRFPGLPIIRARPFNHIGPRQGPQFAIASFARQIAAIEKGKQEPVVHTGNLEARRDLTDVRDVVRGYIDLMDHGEPGEAYNIASGNLVSMQDMLDQLLALAHVRVEVRRLPQLARASEPFLTRVSCAKIRKLSNWRPVHSVAQSLTNILNYWRSTT